MYALFLLSFFFCVHAVPVPANLDSSKGIVELQTRTAIGYKPRIDPPKPGKSPLGGQCNPDHKAPCEDGLECYIMPLPNRANKVGVCATSKKVKPPPNPPVKPQPPVVKGGGRCGGFAGFRCPEGFTCKIPKGDIIADAMGTCVKAYEKPPVVDDKPKEKPMDHGGKCGGIAGFTCPEGFTCQIPKSDIVADAMGTCVPL